MTKANDLADKFDVVVKETMKCQPGRPLIYTLVTTDLTVGDLREAVTLLRNPSPAPPETEDEKFARWNTEMGLGALDAIGELLDSGGIPRGTFADDQVRNLVALYNQRGAEIEALRKVLRLIAEDMCLSDPPSLLAERALGPVGQVPKP